ncbi:MAG TPA: NAD-dependent epimerase/dehydratase family protein [Acidimicrobiales bacterium]|jgi:nucleoside-diphosphate-sugar epimerase|nr:NAD-dependent epimerase/dehydratase family protein [Acidimicrobiales bacterium]
MRVLVTGATGNVGTSVVRKLAADPAVTSIVAVARRAPDLDVEKVRWVAADVSRDDLAPVFAGADVVVHLAWLIQPSHRLDVVEATNVAGSKRVFDAAARAGAGALVYASSVGAYSPGPKDRRVDESWPTEGIGSSFYSRHKAATERLLDAFESAHPDVRVVRLRPGLIFKREAASNIRRLFLGRLLPPQLLRPSLLPVVPRTDRLVFQAVHTDDAAEAYRLAVVGDARGPFNVAAEPVLDPDELGRVLGAHPVPVPSWLLRAGADLSWRAHLQPTPPGWVDLAVGVPVMDTSRARTELGWEPTRTSGEALLELLAGFADRASGPTAPLARRGWRAPARSPVTPQVPAN